MNKETMIEFHKQYGKYGYNDFTKNLYKQYYRKNKNIVFESNLNRINHNKINKIGDYETSVNYVNFITNYPYSTSNQYTNTKGILGLTTKTEETYITINTYSWIFEQLLKSEEHSTTVLDNFNTFITINKEQFEHNKNNNNSIRELTIKFSIYEIPELEYLNTTKEICREFFHKYIQIDWCDSNAYGERGEFMPFKWNLSWKETLLLENHIHEYLTKHNDNTIPYHYWAMLNGYTAEHRKDTQNDEIMGHEQAIRLNHIIEKLT